MKPIRQFTLLGLLVGTVASAVSPLFAQSLSESIEKSKMQEQLYLKQIDSLKRSQGESKPGSPGLGGDKEGEGFQNTVLDSLLQGPLEDSTLEKTEKDTLPKRYSQRIFRTSPGNLFGSYQTAIGRGHILGPGDEIVISLWGDKEVQYRLPVNNSGKVFIEGIGLVSVEGLSIGDAEEKIRGQLSRIYSGINSGTTHVEVSNGKSGPIKVFVLGEVLNPGGFVFSSNTSVLSAYYQARGPTNIGSVRKVKLTRGGKSHELDLYEYLLKGNILSPNTLQDGDILFSNRAEILVEIDGDVGRPAIYELKQGEGIKELLSFAGHLNPSAAKHRVSLRRILDTGDSEYVDLDSPQEFLAGKSEFPLKDGDRILIEKSTEPSDQFVSVVGPVMYPGQYDVKSAKNVSELIEKAGGLQKEAFLGRVHVLRFQPNGSSELFSYSMEDSKTSDIELQGMDHVILYNVKDMYAPDSVQISGAVFNPGTYKYSRGMTVKDLILNAGGYLPQYEKGRAICFRIQNDSRKVDPININLTDGLKNTGEEFPLNPRDLIHIPLDPNWYEKEIVTLTGEFQYPGKHALLHPGERLVDFINRVGGLKKDAYIAGFQFHRTKNQVGRIGVDLEEAMRKSDSRMNISMMGADSLYISEIQNSVKVMGEVGFPTSVLFKKGADVEYYIARAGGFTRFSDKKHVVLEYANGETTSEFYKDPNPGSVIYVPSRPEPEPKDWLAFTANVISILTATAGLIASIIIISTR